MARQYPRSDGTTRSLSQAHEAPRDSPRRPLHHLFLPAPAAALLQSRHRGSVRRRPGHRRDLSLEVFAWGHHARAHHLSATIAHVGTNPPLYQMSVAKTRAAALEGVARAADPPEGAGRLRRPRFAEKGGGFDRNVRDEFEFAREVNYIHRNPVQRGRQYNNRTGAGPVSVGGWESAPVKFRRPPRPPWEPGIPGRASCDMTSKSFALNERFDVERHAVSRCPERLRCQPPRCHPSRCPERLSDANRQPHPSRASR